MLKSLESIALHLNDFRQLEKLIVPREIYRGYRQPLLLPLNILVRAGNPPLPIGLHVQTTVTLNRYDCHFQFEYKNVVMKLVTSPKGHGLMPNG